MLHEVAKLVYFNQHKQVLEYASEEVSPSVSAVEEPSTQPLLLNSLEPLLRMCGSQLQGMYLQNKKQLKMLKSGTVKYGDIFEQQKVIDHLSMTEAEKTFELSLLPSTDRGGMRFPKRGLFPF